MDYGWEWGKVEEIPIEPVSRKCPDYYCCAIFLLLAHNSLFGRCKWGFWWGGLVEKKGESTSKKDKSEDKGTDRLNGIAIGCVDSTTKCLHKCVNS